MAGSKTSTSVSALRTQVRWLQYATFSLVVMLLVVILYAVMTVPSINSGPPRTAVERQIRVLKAEVAKNPRNTQAWGEYIKTLALMGQYSAAQGVIKDADRALKKRVADVSIEEARIALLRGDNKQAVALGEKAAALAKKEYDKEAKELKKKDVVSAPNPRVSVKANLVLAECYIAVGDDEKTLKAYSTALELDPTMSDILVERAKLYIAAGEEKKAKSDLEQALSFIPDYEPAITLLNELER